MKLIYHLTAIACLLAVSSCCVMRTTTITKTFTPVTNNLIADLDVRSEKVTETFTTEIKKKEFVKEEDLRSNAVYEALKKVSADILVAPQYKITRDICNSTIVYTIVVSGYPAYYTNFRQMPMVEAVELRELKEGASYVVVKKSSANNDLDYDRNIIVVPVKGGCKTLDLDDAILDRVVLRGKNAKVEDFSCRDKEPERRHYKASVAQNDYVENTTIKSTVMPKWNPTTMTRNVAASDGFKKTCKYTYKQCKDMETSGIVLTSFGIVSIGVLFPSLLCTDYEATGFAFLGLGMGSTVAGVPLWCVGGVNKKKVNNSNYAYTTNKGFSGVQLSLQGGNGIGLALSF